MSHLSKDEMAVEIGCGSGAMITLPLARAGYRIRGLDPHRASIAYGQEVIGREGLDPELLSSKELLSLDFSPDAVIASEVLEHIPDQPLSELLRAIRSKLGGGGKLLVTVPNGYGWFEWEKFAWQRLRLGRVLAALKLDVMINEVKHLIWGSSGESSLRSTLAASPHLQFFTCKAILRLLESHGFVIEAWTGSVLMAGPFSNLFFSKFQSFLRWNCRMGTRFPRIAAAFFIFCRVPKEDRAGRRA
jgi:SAM-dependent methyltransferase